MLWDLTSYNLHYILVDSNYCWTNGKLRVILWREGYLICDPLSDTILKDGFDIPQTAQLWFTLVLSWKWLLPSGEMFVFHRMKGITHPTGCIETWFQSISSPPCSIQTPVSLLIFKTVLNLAAPIQKPQISFIIISQTQFFSSVKHKQLCSTIGNTQVILFYFFFRYSMFVFLLAVCAFVVYISIFSLMRYCFLFLFFTVLNYHIFNLHNN